MFDQTIVQRQRELVMIFQDEISLALREKRDASHISALVSNFKIVVSMFDEMSSSVIPNSKENIKRRQEEYERGVQQQYRLQQQEVRQTPPSSPPVPTQYAYNDGFQGVTLPQQPSRQEAEYEPYRTQDKEYWEDE
jgi:hypothetical protein